jgi:thioredoxin reductase
MDNEYLTFEQIDAETTIVTRGQNLTKKKHVQKKKATTETAELGTKEDVKKLKEDMEKGFVVLDKKANKEVVEEVIAEREQRDTSTSKFKLFY